MPVMKTPGVYIVEKNAFPNSVVEVATAVPAFVGYTQYARDGSAPLKGPWRISSMAEFERYFGGPPPAKFSVEEADLAVAEFTAGHGVDEKGYRVKLTTTQFRLYAAMRHFFQNYGGACWVVGVGPYKKGADDVTIEASKLLEGIDLLELEQEPTMLVIPDAMELSFADCISVQQAMLKHCGDTMKNRFAILDVHGGYQGRANDKPVSDFRDKLGVNNLMFGAAYFPWVHTRVWAESDLSYRQFDADQLNSVLTDTTPNFASALEDIKLTPAELKAKAQTELASELEGKRDDQIEEALRIWIATREGQIHSALYRGSARFQTILQLAARTLNLMPPSAAMAGLYTMVDNSRGVWKAPANISLQNVVAPAVAISNDEQELLNVDAQGKSINAIRSFIGEGTLVWGARTLEGNSLDWRYINVRRTMIMLEESCRLAAKAMVFEPNTAGTWLTIKSMIQNFLTGIWRRGGLMGAVPDDAFTVHCGLGETMTPEDVLEGILRVTVLVCMVRPAEFIEITFQQQMPKS